MDQVHYYWIKELTDLVVEYIGDSFSKVKLYTGESLAVILGVCMLSFFLHREGVCVCAVKINATRLEHLYFSRKLTREYFSEEQMKDIFAGVALQSRDADPMLGGPFPCMSKVTTHSQLTLCNLPIGLLGAKS